MGKKYTIELERGETAYKTVDSNGTPLIQLLAPTPYTEPDLEQIRKEGYEKGYETAKHECEDCLKQAYTDAIRMEGYQKGLSDAWDAAKKIQDTGGNLQWWIHNVTASEAIEKIRQYEQEKRFHVGDEIETQNGFKGFVIREDDKYVYFVDEKGEGCVETMMAAKTGRHFPEIAEVLRKMKENE